jgi:uncharacterized protein
MNLKTSKRVAAKPYHDLNTPFTVDQNGAYAEYILQEPERMPDLALGANMIVADRREDSAIWVCARVVGLRAISPFSPARESLLYQHDETIDPTAILDGISGPHTHQPMIIRVALDKELINSGERFTVQGVQRPPSAFSWLLFPRIVPEQGIPEPALSDILGVRNTGVFLGNIGFGSTPYMADGKFLRYRLDLENLDNKHIFVVGESGSGKTVFLKSLASHIRTLSDQPRVIMTDVQGDITQMLFPDIVDSPPRLPWEDKAEHPEERYQPENLQLIIPARRDNAPSPNTRALKVLAERRGIKVSHVGLRLQDLAYPSDVEYLFRVSSEQAAMLLDEEAQAIRESEHVPTIAALRNQMRTMQRRAQNGQVTSAAGTTYYKSTCDAALRALLSLEEYFDFHTPSMSQTQDPLDAFDFDGTSILYLEELDSDERMMWEMQLVKWLYANKREDWKVFAFFDEAHQIIPASPPTTTAKGTFERLRVNFERLAREGRKFGINLVLSTQSPQDLHPIVPEQCPTRVVMKINPKNARYCNLEPELALIANSFGHGQFWIQSPFNGTPNWVRIHSPAPAIPHEPMTTYWKKLVERGRKEYRESRR